MSSATQPPAAGEGTRRGRIVISVMVLALVAGGVTVVAVLPGRKKKDAPKKVAPRNVEVLVIQPRAKVPETFVLHGLVEANAVVDVSAEVAGRIENIHLEEGRPCTKGKPLIDLNTDLLSAEMRRDKATAEFAQREFKRLEELRARGVATAVEVDQARSRAQAGQAALDLAQANLDRAGITVPADGVLNRVPVEIGEYVTAGTKVAQIVDVNTVKVVVDMPERLVKYLRAGDSHPVFLDRARTQERSGRIAYISELADERTRTTRVELSVDNARRDPRTKKREFRSGQIVQVEMTLREHADAIMIPLKAVIPLEEGNAVYVVEEGKAARRKVTLGFMTGRDVHVLIASGLQAGDHLIVKGQQLVAPGQAVRVVPLAKNR